MRDELRKAITRLRAALVAPPPPRPEPMLHDRGEPLGVIERDDGRQVRIVWQKLNGWPVVSLRVWTPVEGDWRPEPGQGFTLRVHELPGLMAALGAALDRAKRWADREGGRAS